MRIEKIVRFFAVRTIIKKLNSMAIKCQYGGISFTKYYVTAKENQKDGVTAAGPCLTRTSVVTERFRLGL